MVGFVAGAASCALVVGATAAVAAIPSSTSGVYTACVNKVSGATRVIDYQAGRRCTSSERTITWAKGYRYRGTWSAGTAYAAQDVVVHNGASYVAKVSSTGRTPTQTTYWGLLAAKGDAGPSGPAGPTGSPGPSGPAGPTGPPGETFDDSRATGVPPASVVAVGTNVMSVVSNGFGSCYLRFENYSGTSIDLLVETEGVADRFTVGNLGFAAITPVLPGEHLTRFRAKQGSVSYTGDVWWFHESTSTCTIDAHVVTGSY